MEDTEEQPGCYCSSVAAGWFRLDFKDSGGDHKTVERYRRMVPKLLGGTGRQGSIY
jgi:hypothetical protein